MQQIQNINLNVIETFTGSVVTPTTPTSGVLDAGLTSMSWWIIAAAAAVMMGITALILFLRRRRVGGTFWALLLVPVVALVGGLGGASTLAASALILGQPEFNLKIEKESGQLLTETLASTTVVNTDNSTGYNLSARLQNPLDNNIAVAINGVALTTTDTAIHAEHTTTPSEHDNALALTLPANLPTGQYNFQIVYTITENPPPIQGMTQAACAAMPTYPAAGSTVLMRDVRNHQDYQVRKLADGNCWMITNLKIQDYAATNTDTDLNTIPSFTIPAMTQDNNNADYNQPRIYGPVTASVATNGKNYDVSAPDSKYFGGYFYNWPTATAGETTTTMPGGSGTAPNSICPRGWRLPTGDPGGEFADLDSKIGLAGWQFSGAFRSVFAGDWDNGFTEQGDYGQFWSSSARPLSSDVAYAFFVDNFYPFVDTGNRDNGASVRCVAR
jgi:hypothetical protein